MNHRIARGLSILLAAALVPACGGTGIGKGTGKGNGGAGGGNPNVPNFVIAGAGGLSMVSHGGASTAAATAGGTGGSVNIQGQAGSLVNVETGALSVDSSVTVPSFATNFGTNVRTISAATTITPNGAGDFPGDAAGNATGLRVLTGQTLTLNANTVGGNLCTLNLPNSIQIEGTGQIVMAPVNAAANNDTVGLSVTCGDFIMQPGSSFNGSGAAGSAGLPNGGVAGGLEIITSGLVLLEGTVNAIGGNTAFAGPGGNSGDFVPGAWGLRISSDQGVWITGAVNIDSGSAIGATSTIGGRCDGLAITGDRLPADSGHGVFISSTAAISMNGGNGGGGAGANGGNAGGFGIVLVAGNIGQVVVAGTINANGGNAGAGGGSGGLAGQLNLSTNGSPIIVSTTFTSNGGAGSGGGAGQNGGGGGGFVVDATNSLGAGLSGASMISSGGVAISAGITMNGGAGTIGGPGGTITITCNENNAAPGQNPINVVGYNQIDTAGGAGTVGGPAGSVTIQNLVHTDPQGLTTIGSIASSVPITAPGGAGSAGAGGSGGLVQIGTPLVNTLFGIAGQPLASINTNDTSRTVVNSALIITAGGIGSTNGGAGGTVEVQDYFSAENTGAITADGAAGGAAAGNAGGNGGSLMVNSNAFAMNSGAVSALGGNATIGGQGGGLTIQTLAAGYTSGASSVNSGSLTANGGNGTAGGGSGGSFTVFGHSSAVNSGSSTANGGTGGTGTGGAGGQVRVSSDFKANDTGTYALSGGNSTTGAGGAGGQVTVVSELSSYNGNVTANGGNGGPTGGPGGTLIVTSTVGTSTLHGTMSMIGGTGTVVGVYGNVWEDGVDLPLTGLGTGTF